MQRLADSLGIDTSGNHSSRGGGGGGGKGGKGGKGGGEGEYGDVGYTCEAAEFFFLYHVQSRIEKFEADVAKQKEQQQRAKRGTTATKGTVRHLFPFRAFFANAPPERMFASQKKEPTAATAFEPGANDEAANENAVNATADEEAVDLEIARGCFRHLGKLFEELRDFRYVSCPINEKKDHGLLRLID